MKIKISDISLAVAVCGLIVVPILLGSQGTANSLQRVLWWVMFIFPITSFILAITSVFKKEFGIHIIFWSLSGCFIHEVGA